MTELDFTYAVDPGRLGAAVQDSLVENPLHVHPPGPVETVRTDRYGEHDISVRTTYLIEIDGRPIGGHLFVTNSGDVQVHALPNYSFASAIDMARQLIDAFPDGFGPEHDHGEDH
ncbi:hypothetical protein ACQEVB_14230 [Pseudonocardia sp. CA-107938]|uniref:hypothetical protein n=1 Tax=Pseudonocardia sp. CA-107938 TaxID=3240021 RepID=UPI003D93D5A0